MKQDKSVKFKYSFPFACITKRFFLLFLLVAFSGRNGKSFLSNFYSVVLADMCDHGSPSLDTLPNYCVYVLKFRVCGHGMPYALEINSNDGLKQGHVESCPSSTKNYIYPLPQCL